MVDVLAPAIFLTQQEFQAAHVNRIQHLFFGPPLALLSEGETSFAELDTSRMDEGAREALASRLEAASFADLVATVEAFGF